MDRIRLYSSVPTRSALRVPLGLITAESRRPNKCESYEAVQGKKELNSSPIATEEACPRARTCTVLEPRLQDNENKTTVLYSIPVITSMQPCMGGKVVIHHVSLPSSSASSLSSRISSTRLS